MNGAAELLVAALVLAARCRADGQSESDRCSSAGCDRLPACLDCAWPADCRYGATVRVRCTPSADCERALSAGGGGDANDSSPALWHRAACLYCWQTDGRSHQCGPPHRCQVRAGGGRLVLANCTVPERTLCMGERTFAKRVPCDWTSGYKWSTAFALSVTLGGFGADRFYLGLWKSGMGKLFSFGGLGLWTLIDIVLVAVGYLMPADGSAYVY